MPGIAPDISNLSAAQHYGRRNRQAIATRETRIAARLRAVEQAYRMAIEHDTVLGLPESSAIGRSLECGPDREVELE